MSTAFSGKDGVGLYLSAPLGSAAAGTVAGALGGARMPVQVRAADAIVTDAIPPLIIEYIGGDTPEGTGEISGLDTGNLVAWKAPGDDFGTSVAIANGGVAVLESDTLPSWVRVRRDSSATIESTMSLQVRKIYDNLVGMGDVDAAHSASGDNEYLAGMVCNHGTVSTDVSIYLKPLGTIRTTTLTQLASTGGGYINCGTNTLTDWKPRGWALIRKADDSIREAVYYTSRTSSTISVPAGAGVGRARLGTTASAGANTDTITPIAGLRLALEAPTGEGVIQTIANRRTAPTGVSWAIPTTPGTALTITGLLPTGNHGLWIHREIPVSCIGALEYESAIAVRIGSDETVYRGLYRVESAALVEYNVFQGIDAFPDFDAAPAATETALPFDFALSAPVSGVRTHQITVRATDGYGVTGYNVFPHLFRIDSTGASVGDITPPSPVTITEIGSGYVQLQATYSRGVDAVDADLWRYWIKTDGTDPDPTDTPTAELAMSIGLGLADTRVLDVTLGPYVYSTDLRVLVRAVVDATDTESPNLDPVTDTVSLVDPATPALGSAAAGTIQNYDTGSGFAQVTTYLNAPTNTVYWRTMPGCTELWAGGVLALRAMACGEPQVTLYVPSTLSLTEASVSGAGVAGPVQVVSATEIYICVGGVRRAKIDLTALTITADEFDSTGAILPEDAPPVGPAVACPDFTACQVFDPVLGRWRSFLCVNDAGLFSARWINQTSS